jgi:hypothetical protein
MVVVEVLISNAIIVSYCTPSLMWTKEKGQEREGEKQRQRGGLCDLGNALPLHLFLFLTPLSHFRYPSLVGVQLPKEWYNYAHKMEQETCHNTFKQKSQNHKPFPLQRIKPNSCFIKQNKSKCNTNNLIDFWWFKIFSHLQQIGIQV